MGGICDPMNNIRKEYNKKNKFRCKILSYSIS